MNGTTSTAIYAMLHRRALSTSWPWMAAGTVPATPMALSMAAVREARLTPAMRGAEQTSKPTSSSRAITAAVTLNAVDLNAVVRRRLLRRIVALVAGFKRVGLVGLSS